MAQVTHSAMIDPNCQSGSTVQTVVLAIPVEAAAVDAFVQELDRLEAELSGAARLKGKEIS